jgi:hypothetical protein
LYVYDLTPNEHSVTCVKAEYTCQVDAFAADFLERRVYELRGMQLLGTSVLKGKKKGRSYGARPF